jgi:hypothetical protein
MPGLENSPSKANIEIHIFYVNGLLYETKTIMNYVFLQIKSVVYDPILTQNLQTRMTNSKSKIKNTCFPPIYSLSNMPQIIVIT